MGRNRFASRDVVRYDLSDGDWIEVRTELTRGEQARLNARMYGRIDVGGVATGAVVPGIDLEAAAVDALATWLTDWSFRDADDKPVALSRDAIAALDDETGDEIQAVIARHIAEYERGKPTPNGKPKRAVPSG